MGAALLGAHFPDDAHGAYAQRWLLPFAQYGTRAWIENLDCDVGAVSFGHTVLPFTVSSGLVRDNAYVASPYTHYVSYLDEELRLIEDPRARLALAKVIQGLGALLRRAEIDKVVILNNWMLSTNLYPASISDTLPHLVAAMRERFPEHALLFRSLNETTTGSVMTALDALGFSRLLSRRVYLFDSSDASLYKRKGFRRDSALISKRGYRVQRIEAAGDHAARIVALYNALYLDKYSRHNPAFTPEFVELAIRDELLEVHGLFQGDRLDGVIGFFARDGIMTTPLLGYDTSLPADTGLYRMLTALLSQLARDKGLFLHRSSGAATFKRSRGAVPALEYSMVDARHLPLRRRAGWNMLRFITEHVGKPLLEKYDR